MAWKNQQEFIDALDNAGEVLRIKAYVDPKLEIAEITDRISKSGNGGKALLFENTGYDFPVLMNAYGSEKRMCMALGVNHLDDIAKEIESLFHLLSSPKESIIDKLKLLPKLGQFASWMPKVKKGRGECQEVIMENPDITKLPVITCWPKDGGPFITMGQVYTQSLNGELKNLGMYRLQVFPDNTLGMHWQIHKDSNHFFHDPISVKTCPKRLVEANPVLGPNKYQAWKLYGYSRVWADVKDPSEIEEKPGWKASIKSNHLFPYLADDKSIYCGLFKKAYDKSGDDSVARLSINNPKDVFSKLMSKKNEWGLAA